MDAGHSIWAITPEERDKHDKQFDTLLPALGYLSGDQTRRFFLQSGLPASVLAEIWALADMNKDGKMDRLEFSIAMKLIKLKLLGQALPSALPIVMKQAPARPPVASTCSGMGSMPNLSLMATTPMLPAVPAATSMNSIIPLNAMTPVGPTSPLPSLIVPALTNGTPGIFQPSSVTLALNLPHSTSLSSSPLGFTNTGMTKARSLLDLESSSSNSSSNNSPVRISQKTGCSDWAVPQSSRLKYRLQFNSLDKQMTGYLSGPQVRNTLITSNLTQTQLATIWNLADFDKDGKLTADEFILAMHLVDVAKVGQPLPLALPRDLVPPSVRGNLADKANGTIPSICVGRYEEFEAEPPQKTKINVKFEDKRKENLDRGNAELEHRRQALQEQQRKEEERRARETQEERERLEREARQVEERRQQEREQRQQRQREAERQKEEERQKELERKEAAKQEQERQRKLEWEQRKRQELQRLRNQEQEDVLQLKARKKSLEMELEAVDDKHKQISDRLRDARSKKKIQKGALDMVNQDRDRHSMEISTLQQQFEDYQKKLVLLVPEHQRLRERLGNLASNNLPSSAMTVLQGGVMEKEITCRKLKEQLDALEKETTLKLFVMQEYNKDIKFEDMDDSVLQSLLSLLGCLSKLFYLIKDLRASQRKQQSALDKLYKIKEDKLWNLQRGRGREEETIRQAKLEEDWQWQQELLREEESRQRRLQEEREARLREEEQEALDLLRARGGGDCAADSEEKKRKEEANGVKEEEETRETERADGRMLHVLRFSLGDEDERRRKEQGEEEGRRRKEQGEEEGRRRKEQGEEEGRRRKEQGEGDEISARPREPGAWLQQGCTKSEIHEQRLGGPDGQKGALHPVAPAHGKPATLNSYRGLYPFTARNADELTFAADDLIEVDEMTVGGPGWLYGSCRGGIGWFPNSYVEKLAVPEASTVEPEASTVEPEASTVEQAQMPRAVSSITHGTEEEAGILLTGHSDSSVVGQGPAFKPTHVTVSTSAEHGQEVGSVQAQTLCSWNVKKDGHLNFSKDDVITVLEQQENWWLGELNGDRGWFPKSYVSLVTGNGAPSGSMCSYPDGCDSMETAQSEEYVALYTYESPEAGALTFSEGNTILVTEKNGEWWRGCIGDRSGAFPASYVKPKEDNSSGYASRPGAPGKRPEIALVVTGYTAAGTEQLSLSPGQHILLLTKNPTGWWLGELQARGKKRKTGLFPASHVKILGPSSGISSPVPVPICQVTAMYDYTPASEVEISFSKGQLINVLENNDPDWWKGETNGTTGLFPSNYVKMTTNESDPSQQWCADLMSLDTMSPAEKKRQDYIHELIETEERYVEDLQLVLEVFHKPMSESGRLTDEELSMIFVNWKELIVSNTKLLKALRGRKMTCGERRQVQMIGDILAAELSHMQAYVGFCSCQLNGASLLQLKTDQEADFKDFLKKLATDHRCKGMPLSSFLLKPMQRITRYPLIIKNLLESTPETHLDHGQLQEALVKAEELCFQVNEGVREKENAERLEWIQTHVQCEGITENLIFNSLTNCLGPRKLLHSGKLYKTKSHKELHAFLFNDFLLFTQATKQVSSSGPDKLFSSKSNIQFKLYKTPVFLNEVLVKLPSEPCNDEAVFLISHIDRVYSLKTENINERTAWVQKIKTASEDFIETEKKKREKAYHARSLKSSGIGRLLVTIREATELKSSKPNGKSNPYCEVTMGEQGYTSRTLSDTLNPKWNFNCQFFITDLYQDVLSITIFERDQFSPDEFLGRTEVPVATIKKEFENRGPSDRQLLLHEVPTGEVWVRLDLQLFDQDTVR